MKSHTYKTPLYLTPTWLRYPPRILLLAGFLALSGLSQSGCIACIPWDGERYPVKCWSIG